MDEARVQRVMAHYGCDREDAVRYLDLRDEGHSQYAAALTAGIADPHEQAEERKP